MSDGRDWTPTIVAALLGVFVVGYQTTASNQQTNIDNLPAVIARLEAVESEVADLRTAFAGIEAVSERITALEGQISRRFIEVVQQPLELIRNDVEKNEDVIMKIIGQVATMQALIE